MHTSIYTVFPGMTSQHTHTHKRLISHLWTLYHHETIWACNWLEIVHSWLINCSVFDWVINHKPSFLGVMIVFWGYTDTGRYDCWVTVGWWLARGISINQGREHYPFALVKVVVSSSIRSTVSISCAGGYLYMRFPSGNLTQLWKITMFSGKTHYSYTYGHFQ